MRSINFQSHRAKKNYIEAVSDWLVKTDISRFYPSIYTHSIPWAAYGKDKVKSNIPLYEGSLADRIDVLLRACNRNQTVGIPIGPESSRIIAEIISARIDNDFAEKAPYIENNAIDRLQDDWFIGLKTLESAERALSTIGSVYRNYSLDINGSKTSVTRVIGEFGQQWVSEIGAFLSHKPGPVRGSRLREFLYLSIRMQIKFPSEAVTSYVLSIIETQSISPADVEPLESFLLKSALISPSAMNVIGRLLINIQHTTKRLSCSRIADRFTSLAISNLSNERTYEAIWQIYTLRGLKTKLKASKFAEMQEGAPSSVVGLLLLDMESKGLVVGRLPKVEWSKLITEEKSLADASWLLGYEGIRHGWLSDTNRLSRTPFFDAMLSRNIVFYDDKRNVLPSSGVVRRKLSQRAENIRETQLMLLAMRGFDFGKHSG
nr:RNA-directed DNA polymerase [Methylobacterium sp. WL103]